MEYASKNYLEAIEVCNTIIREISQGILQPDTDDDRGTHSKKTLNPKYCRIARMEMLVLEMLENWEIYGDSDNAALFDNMCMNMNAYHREAVQQDDNTFYDNLLIEYYKVLFDIIVSKNYVSILDYKRHFINWIRTPLRRYGREIYDGFILWNFNDIQDTIRNMYDPWLCTKKGVLLDVTAYAISFRDKFQMQSWGRSVNL